MKKILGLQAPMELTSGTYREDPIEDLAFHSLETSFTTQRRTR